LLIDFLDNYIKQDKIRCHMPGHKGLYPRDITEISGADCLYKANGVILQDERRAAKLFNCEDTFFSVGGCTLCIQTLVYLFREKNIYYINSVHPAFLNVCKILNITPIKVENPEEVGEKGVLYITSPDYFGRIADIKGISEIIHKKDSFLVVDNAHGAHLAFTSENHPIHCGADFTCDSGFKTLPALTGAAYIHTVHKGYRDKVKQIMSIFGSSSPNYLILASLDGNNEYVQKSIKKDISRTVPILKQIKKRHNPKTDDLFHIALQNTIDLKNIEPEYVNEDFVILLFSIMSKSLEEIRGILNDYIPYISNDNDQERIFNTYI
jgi:arginine/lysine/ornithine decarboxylase